MAKGQKRSGREAKKPKSTKKPAATTSVSPFSQPQPLPKKPASGA